MFVPIFFNSGNSGGFNPLAMLIAFNVAIFISLITMICIYIGDTYDGSFWEWSWDMDNHTLNSKLEWIKTSNSGIAGVFFWIPFFVINGIALLNWLTVFIEEKLTGK